MRGTLGPQMSTSSKPTSMLRAEKPKDSCAETVLLPTPPLPQQTKVFQGVPRFSTASFPNQVGQQTNKPRFLRRRGAQKLCRDPSLRQPRLSNIPVGASAFALDLMNLMTNVGAPEGSI